MMVKLLHEKLLDWEDNGDGTYSVGLGNIEIRTTKSALESLADEIERYYIPRPRFEDWEPVQFGDKTGNLESVDIIEFRQDGTFQLGEKRKSGCGTYIGIYEAGELVKRPTPKICDADGVEIKVGDTVWTSMYTDNPYTVERISTNHKSEPLVMVEEMGSGLFPATCYHERPVFDAEGMRICKGDTVYDVDGINPEPMRVLSYGDALVNVMSKSGIEKSYEFNELTHREPDSIQSIAQYAKDEAVRFAGCIEPLNNVADRLTAIIERSA